MSDTPKLELAADGGLPRHALLSVAQRCGDIVTEGHPDDDDLWIPVHEIVKNGCCDWKENEDRYWESECGIAFGFDGGWPPSAQKFRYCPGCGKLLTETPYIEEDDSSDNDKGDGTAGDGTKDHG
jgi:hypothetical protein